MKIRLERDGTVFEYEHNPMERTRFRALCRLARTGILGAVFLGALHIAGSPIVYAGVALVVLYGLYKLIQEA